ncbi:hypothetical protein [Microseira sp. BLCC-F43]|uniref:hypothetical protein n=1 Tax=Microseira sp. BLCC-F43 TaxID=3153602 RepID=UPI0035B773B4
MIGRIAIAYDTHSRFREADRPLGESHHQNKQRSPFSWIDCLWDMPTARTRVKRSYRVSESPHVN